MATIRRLVRGRRMGRRMDAAGVSALRNGAWQKGARLALLCAALGLGLAACSAEPQMRGYVFDEKLLNDVKPGTDAQKVLQIMGTPSTVSTVGNQSWYYISQVTTQRLAFMKPSIVDQRVTAIYFNKNMKVERIASYGMQDGVVFDFVSRTTPTGGT
jgi:outer membrane protein assembly factor BamE (lipoprotein component of BamABCDE complex)